MKEGMLTPARALCRFAGNAYGMAAVEFTMVAPVLMFILIGTADVGTGLYRKMQVQSAATSPACTGVRPYSLLK